MKLSQFYTLESLRRKRQEASEALAVAESAKGLGITINGRYQDDEIIAECNKAIAGVFRARLAKIDAELQALGIEVDA